MRRIVPVLMLIGLTAAVVAQAPEQRMNDATIVSGAVKMQFAKVVVKGTVSEATGVKFTINGTEISADEATIDRLTQEVTLRGNVRMKLPK